LLTANRQPPNTNRQTPTATLPTAHSPCYTSPIARIVEAEELALARRIGGMNDSTRFTIICPGCDATMTIDSQTGAVISHEEKTKPLASFEDMVKGLDKQKQVREQIFSQELSSMKDRERLLEEKFQEAMKRAEKDKDKPYRNPMDMD
jgi:hypothetical protein